MPGMTEKIDLRNKFIIAILIIAAAVIIRLYNVNGAMFDFNPLRQALNASVARNYAQNPSAMFLLPQSINVGPAPGYLMFEFPILPYAVSFLVKAAGVQNWIFRVPSVIFFAFSAMYFYKVCVEILDPRTSLFALVFYCITPMTILMGRVFQSESFMMFALMFALYYFLRWIRSGKRLYLLLYTVGLMFFVLLKIPNLYIFLFFAGIFLFYKKTKLAPYFIASLVLIGAVNFWWWFIYSSEIRSLFPTQYTMVGGNVPVFSLRHVMNVIREYSLSASYWITTFKQCLWTVFSPLVFVLFIIGIFLKKDKEVSVFILAWVGSVLLLLFTVPSAAVQDYYKIHLVPAGVICAAIGYFWTVDKIRSVSARKVIVSCFWIAAALSIFVIVYPYIRYKPIFENQQILAEKVKEISKKDDLIIAAFGSDAMLLFYCDRKGWNDDLRLGARNIDLLEERRREGAKYYVSGNLDEFEGNPEFSRHMKQNYELVSREGMEYSEPRRSTLDHLLWSLASKIDTPAAKKICKKFERSSLGYVIFDIRKRRTDVS